QVPAVGVEGDGVHAARVAFQHATPIGGQVPDDHGPVPVRRSEQPAIRTEYEPVSPLLGARGEGTQRPAGRRVPEPHRAGARGAGPAVGAEGHCAHGDGVSGQDQGLLVQPTLQQAPFPAALVGRALVEQLLGAGRVQARQLAPRQGDPLEVGGGPLAAEGLPLAAEGLLEALVCRQIVTALIARPTATSTSAAATTVAIANATLFRRANLRKRYAADGGPASPGSSSRYRLRSAARPLAVSYRRLRSFSSAFITIQSSSPRTSPLNLRGSMFRRAAI